MKRRTALPTLALVLLVLLGEACLDDECRLMKRCCAAVSERPWIGDSCGELARGVRDPATCRTIRQTIEDTFAHRNEALPSACIEDP